MPSENQPFQTASAYLRPNPIMARKNKPRPLQNSPQSPKLPPRHLGDFL
ncbi:hypothetical protein [Neisseria cinerea]